MRPIYETPQDRANELSVWERICSLYNCTYLKSYDLNTVDGVLIDEEGNRVAVVEIKNRRNTHDKYPTYMLSANKWRRGMHVASEMGLPFLLFVNFTDGIYYTKLKKHYDVSMGGRTDRFDSFDQEGCIYIDMSDFRKMEG